MVAPVSASSASWLVVEDPVVVVEVGSSTPALAAELLVVSDDCDELDCVAANVSVVFVEPADVVVVVSETSLLPDDESDDVDEPEPVELLLLADDADPEVDAPPDADAPPVPPLDDPPELESSACAMPVPLASAIPTPSVTAPTPSHP